MHALNINYDPPPPGPWHDGITRHSMPSFYELTEDVEHEEDSSRALPDAASSASGRPFGQQTRQTVVQVSAGGMVSP